MSAIMLQNENQDMLGFLMIADDSALSSNKESDCILTGVPQNGNLYDTPLCQIIQNHKNVEYLIQPEKQPNTFSVDLKDGWKIFLSVDKNKEGNWLAKNEEGVELKGKLKALEK